MDGNFIGGLLLVATLSAVGYFLAMIVVAVAERSIERDGKFKQLRNDIARRARIEAGLTGRLAKLTLEQKNQEHQIRYLLGRHRGLAKETQEMSNSPDQRVRILGEELSSNNGFLALLTNRNADAAKAGTAATMIESAWIIPQVVEVWAGNLGEAKAMLEKRYPPSLGFVVNRLTHAMPPQPSLPAAAG